MQTLADQNLTQMVTEPTRYENVLDIVLTNNSTLFKKAEIMPGLLDLEIVYIEVSIKPQIMPQKPDVMSKHTEADNESVNKLQEGTDKFVPKKTISSKLFSG